jgi:leucyl/phenylalanyl-tRNA--protein transferase
MPIHLLNDEPVFPPVEEVRPDGLLAVGGDLSLRRLLSAYRLGIFPWYETPPVLWWYPDPRFVLFPAGLRVSKTMKQILRREQFEVTVNRAFGDVIRHCASVPRAGQRGTWINSDMIRAYELLHEKGYGQSVEAWQDGKLAGGLYGVRMGNVFFGESMFTLVPNASKAAFITFVRRMEQQGLTLIDCQVYTSHLASLGADFIPGTTFQQCLKKAFSEWGEA